MAIALIPSSGSTISNPPAISSSTSGFITDTPVSPTPVFVSGPGGLPGWGVAMIIIVILGVIGLAALAIYMKMKMKKRTINVRELNIVRQDTPVLSNVQYTSVNHPTLENTDNNPPPYKP